MNDNRNSYSLITNIFAWTKARKMAKNTNKIYREQFTLEQMMLKIEELHKKVTKMEK